MANLTDAKYLHFSFLFDVLHREKSDALILDTHALIGPLKPRAFQAGWNYSISSFFYMPWSHH